MNYSIKSTIYYVKEWYVMKKVLMLMAAIILIYVVPVFHVYGENEPEFIVSGEDCFAGEKVTVKILSKNNSGIIAWRLFLSYDSDIFQLESVNERDFKGIKHSKISDKKDPFVLMWGDAVHSDNMTNGILAELTFKVGEYAKTGEYKFSLSYDKDDVYNNNFQQAKFNTVDGYLTVKETVSELTSNISENSAGEIQRETAVPKESEVSDKIKITAKSDEPVHSGFYTENDLKSKQICNISSAENQETIPQNENESSERYNNDTDVYFYENNEDIRSNNLNPDTGFIPDILAFGTILIGIIIMIKRK